MPVDGGIIWRHLENSAKVAYGIIQLTLPGKGYRQIDARIREIGFDENGISEMNHGFVELLLEQERCT